MGFLALMVVYTRLVLFGSGFSLVGGSNKGLGYTENEDKHWWVLL